MVLVGQYSRIPYFERICSCSVGRIETKAHITFDCPLRDEARKKFILPLLSLFLESSMTIEPKISWLLSDSDFNVTVYMAKFFATNILIVSLFCCSPCGF